MDVKYHYDRNAADSAVRFIETMLTHTKGEWADKPLLLEEWQKEHIIRPIFGEKRADGTRRYRKVFIFLPRKNGKSLLAAAIALYCLVADKEQGAEVYSVATDREQARLVFDMAKKMIQNNSHLSQAVKVFQYSLHLPKTNSSYKYVSADADTKHGYNTHAVIYDELHAAPNRDLYDVFDTSFGSRKQPLFVMITTAGYDRQSICYEQYDYAKKVKAGIIKDDTFLPVIYEADPGDDIFSEETWKKANPNYGVSLYKDYIAEQARKARIVPSYENTFRRLHLNQWTASEIRWINDEDWMRCDMGAMEIAPGSECYGALDLSSVRDITCYLRLYPMEGRYLVKPMFFIPELTGKDRRQKDGVNYETWVRQGYIIETPGSSVDYDYIEKYILQSQQDDNLVGCAYDQWGASQLVTRLLDRGVNMQPWRQGYASMSTPTKELERLVLNELINHEGNPVMRWMCSNVMLQTDAAGNIKIAKDKSTEKVDGMVALAMALGYYMHLHAEDAGGTSVYEDRDIITL